ncbi:MAG: ABC-F family ATP-binding cassette domain-containing protein [Turicibacter sp.]|nr:ABC-F family ATP-binding cassette domain-containing protein [Turicibacter sp.]
MNLMTIENIKKSYSVKTLLNNISFGIAEGEKIGLIGVNGTGKSTLLKIIAGRETPEAGQIVKGNKVRVEYLSQNPEYEPKNSVLEQIFKGDSKEMTLLRKYQEALDAMTQDYNESTSKKLLQIQEEIEHLHLWDLESEAKSILTKLGITNFSQKMSELSGGQRKRVALASALITPCELLILDEPTNHLDNDTIRKLEDYLNSRKGSLLMITHDRYFLDRVTNRILELDKGNLYSYEGNYSLFLEKKVERMQMENAREDKRQNLLRKELAWVRRGAQARSTKQKARLQRFDELKNQDGPSQNAGVDISVASTRLGKKILEFHHVGKSFGDKVMVRDLDYVLARQDRIGIIGPNGVGKSTLINMIKGDLLPDSGEIVIGETVKIAAFSQEIDFPKPTMRAIDYIKENSEMIETSDGSKITASQMCERFLFDGHLQYSQIGTLSGGEKRRLHLLRLLMDAPNVLLFDEPTNDLDIDTLNRLEDYLDDFKGIVITVSHDRYFLDRICNKIFAYEGDGNIRIYTGNYSDYISFKEALDAQEAEVSKQVEEKAKIRSHRVDKPKFSYKEQKEFEVIDDEIADLENAISQLDLKMAESAADYVKLQELMAEKSEVEAQLEVKMERWEYLNELNEQING